MMSMKAKHIDLSHLLPKTGLVTSYRAGDDGEYEVGWWRGLLNADNKIRFLAKTLDGDDVVIDLATGLMWPADGHEAGWNSGSWSNWFGAIDYALALDFAGFTDWRLPNIKELFSIADFSVRNPCLDTSFFVNMATALHWSSTTYPTDSSRAWSMNIENGVVQRAIKGYNYYSGCVRGGL